MCRPRPGRRTRARSTATASTGRTPTAPSCHALMDPIGFGLENFDELGRYRTHDEGRPECPIDGRGQPSTTAPPFTGAQELATLLAELARLLPCVAEYFIRFAAGRGSRRATICGRSGWPSEMDTTGNSFAGDAAGLRDPRELPLPRGMKMRRPLHSTGGRCSEGRLGSAVALPFLEAMRDKPGFAQAARPSGSCFVYCGIPPVGDDDADERTGKVPQFVLPDAAGPLARALQGRARAARDAGPSAGHDRHLVAAHPPHRLGQRAPLRRHGLSLRDHGPPRVGRLRPRRHVLRRRAGPLLRLAAGRQDWRRHPLPLAGLHGAVGRAHARLQPWTTSRSGRGRARSRAGTPPTRRERPGGVAAGGLRPAVLRVHPAHLGRRHRRRPTRSCCRRQDILARVRQAYARLQPRLGAADRQRLDQHLENVRHPRAADERHPGAARPRRQPVAAPSRRARAPTRPPPASTPTRICGRPTSSTSSTWRSPAT